MAPSTRKSYAHAVSQYLLFCRLSCIPALPLTEYKLIMHCTSLSRRVAAKTIKCYLAGISFFATSNGFHTDIASMHRLRYLIRGIKRTQGNSFACKYRAPITNKHMVAILYYLRSSSLPRLDKQLWWASCTLAFFGLLRVSEYTCPHIKKANRTTCLCIDDVHIDQQGSGMVVHIKTSKSDPFSKGCSIQVGATNNVLCPVQAMFCYISSRVSLSFPLFVFANGTFLTRSRMSAFLSSVLGTHNNINTHSFRIGGATALALAGVPDSTIQILGRWASNCFIRYLRFSPGQLRSFAQYMSERASERDTEQFWDPHKGKLRDG